MKYERFETHMPQHILGIDIGTTATKVIVIDNAGNLLAESSRSSILSSPKATWAEENPEQWWQNICLLVPEVLQKANIQAQDIAGIGVSGMVPALILLSDRNQVLRPSIQQNDARALDEIKLMQQNTNEIDILNKTGSAITQQSIGPKVLWLRHHEPELLKQACHIMGSYDYIGIRLTGKYSLERNWAFESGLFDFHREDWDDSLLSLAGIDRSWLSEIHWPADVIGEVTTEAAKESGLAAGTPVVAGSADHIASAFSAGLHEPGDLLIKLGGAGDILFCLNEPKMDPRLFLDYHVIPGQFLLNGCMASSGSLIRWFRDQFAPESNYSDLDHRAQKIPAGSDGLVLLPYFLGEKTPLNDPLARGTIVGLTLTHTSAHFYRAILEGISFGFNHHLVVLSEHGLEPTRVRLTNGGAHSELWRQITSDVIGLPLEQVAQHPGSSLGSAFVAGKGGGVFQDWQEIELFIKVATVTMPDKKNHVRYKKLFEVYREVYEKLKSTYPTLIRAVS
jgi:xylulokinase